MNNSIVGILKKGAGGKGQGERDKDGRIYSFLIREFVALS